MRAHTKWFIEFLWNVKPNDFDGNLSAFDFALKYVGRARVLRRLQGVVTDVLELHRVGDHLVAAAKLAEFVQSCWYFPIKNHAPLEVL